METIGGAVKALAISGGGSPQKRESSKLQRTIDERMTLSESIEAATAIVDRFPNGGLAAGKGYIGAIAAAARRDYPGKSQRRMRRSAQRRCSRLPIPSDRCRRCGLVRARHGAAASRLRTREADCASNLPSAREPSRSQPSAYKRYTYGEFLEWATANSQKPRPIGRFEGGGGGGGEGGGGGGRMNAFALEIRCYRDLLEAISALKNERGLSHETIEDICGLTRGHWFKVFGPNGEKQMGWMMFDFIPAALGFKIRMELDEPQAKLMQARWERRNGKQIRVRSPQINKMLLEHAKLEVFSEMGRRGGLMRAANRIAANSYRKLRARRRELGGVKEESKRSGSV